MGKNGKEGVSVVPETDGETLKAAPLSDHGQRRFTAEYLCRVFGIPKRLRVLVEDHSVNMRRFSEADQLCFKRQLDRAVNEGLSNPLFDPDVLLSGHMGGAAQWDKQKKKRKQQKPS